MSFSRHILSAILLAGLAGDGAARAGDGPTLAELVETHGLAKVGAAYVVREEAGIRPRLDEIRARLAEVQAAFADFAEIEAALAVFRGLQHDRADAGARLGQLNVEMDQIPGMWVRGRYYRGNTAAQHDYFNGLKAQADQLKVGIGEMDRNLNHLRAENPQGKAGPAKSRLEGRRETARDEIRYARQAVDAVAGRYAELAREPALLLALKAAGQDGLNPSEGHLANVKALERFEKLADLKPAGGRPAEAPKPAPRRKSGRR